MTIPRKRARYAEPHIKALSEALASGVGLQEAAEDAVWFLRKRLTAAAIAGCHHCGEGDKGAPCRWCGLKN